MDLKWNPQINQDIDRLHKVDLLAILRNYRLPCKDEDTVDTLRKVTRALRRFLNDNCTVEAEKTFRQLVIDGIALTPTQLGKYPDLQTIQEYVTARQNIYDVPEGNEELEHKHTEIELPRGTQKNQLNIAKEAEIYSEPPQKEDNSVQTEVEIHKEPPLIQHNIQRNMAESRPLISGGCFNGLPSENPMDFLDKYEIAAGANRWAEETKLALFPAHLSGNALTWYAYYKEGNQNLTWEQVKREFTQTFAPMAQSQNLQAILDAKIQGENQPAINYYLDILTLCRRHDPEMTEVQIINNIVQGLRPEICEYVINEEINTLNQLRDCLKKIESKLVIKNQNKHKYNRLAARPSSWVKQEQTQEENHDKMTDLSMQIEKLVHVVSKMSVTPQVIYKDSQRGIRGREQRERSSERGRQYSAERSREDLQPRGRSDSWKDFREPRGREEYEERRGRSNERRVKFGNPQWRERDDSRGRVAISARVNDQHAIVRYNPNNTDDREEEYCRFCRKYGHRMEDCRRRRNKEQNGYSDRYRYCRWCKTNTHNTEKCYSAVGKTYYPKNGLEGNRRRN